MIIDYSELVLNALIIAKNSGYTSLNGEIIEYYKKLILERAKELNFPLVYQESDIDYLKKMQERLEKYTNIKNDGFDLNYSLKENIKTNEISQISITSECTLYNLCDVLYGRNVKVKLIEKRRQNL
ncbi:MAG: hypothetical protein ACK5HP_05020 [Bacilli bacterium]